MKHWPVLIPLLLALLAFRQVTGFQYTGNDAAGWMLSADWGTADGLRWSLTGPHYIGYRPLTALSFCLDFARGGLEPATYHQTDLALHLAHVLLAYALGALLLGRPSGAVMAVIVAVHPVTVQAVPVLARRGDLLVSVFGALAVLLVLRGRWIAGAVASTAAFACKEVAVVLPVLLSVVSYLEEPDPERRARSVVRTGAAALLGIVILILARFVLLERLGGYPSERRLSWFQVAAEFLTNLWLPTARMLPVDGSGAAWRYVFLLLAVLGLALSLGLGLHRDQPARIRTAALLGGAWLGLQLGLWLATSFFTERLLYPSLLPLALIVCTPLGSRRLGLPLAALPFALTLLAIGSGPLVRGLPEWEAASRYQANVIESLRAKLGAADTSVVVLNHPTGVLFDPASRPVDFRSLADLETATVVVGHLGDWLAALEVPKLKLQRLNDIVFEGPDVVIPLAIEEHGARLVVTLGPGAYRSYRSSRILDSSQRADAPNQPIVKTRRELRLPPDAKLFVFDGRDGELRDFPKELELTFAPP